MTSPTDGVYLAPDLDEQAQSRALLREVIGWARANGWARKHALDDFGQPITERHWHQWVSDQDLSIWIETDPDGLAKLSVELEASWLELLVSDDLALAVDVLAAVGVLPAPMSSGYKAGYSDGHADGCHAVTDMSVMNMLDIELDKLDEPDRKAELKQKIEGWLPDDPYRSRLAVDEIVNAVWEVMEHKP